MKPTVPNFIREENLRRNRDVITLTSAVLSRTVNPMATLKVGSTLLFEAWGCRDYLILENGAFLYLGKLNLQSTAFLTKRRIPLAWFDAALLDGREYLSSHTSAFVEEFVVKPILEVTGQWGRVVG